MNRLLFTQIWNRRRTNVWLVLELLVVSVVLWYIVDSLYVTYKKSTIPEGFNTEHCYLISFQDIDSTSPLFRPGADADPIKNRSQLLDRIKQRPEVEAACMVYYGIYPYGSSSNSAKLGYYNAEDSLVNTGYIYIQETTSQYPRVFRISGHNGETPEQLAEILKKDKVLLTKNAFNDDKVKPEQFIDKRIYLENPTTAGGVISPLRIWPSLMPQEYVIRNSSIMHGYANIAFRVRSEMDNDIVNTILADLQKMVSGNLIISDVESFADIKYYMESSTRSMTRKFITVALFLLVNIFLGLLGTFWFRTQQRTGEIAMRKVAGATDGQILGRIISEGLVLLTVATLPAIVLDLTIAHYQLTKELYEFISWERSCVCIAVTYLLMALMIVLGTLPPALKAMRVNPATALKDE